MLNGADRMAGIKKIAEPVIAIVLTWAALNLTKIHFGHVAAWAVGAAVLIVACFLLIVRRRE